MPYVLGGVVRVELDKHVVERRADLNGSGTLQRQADQLDGYGSGSATRAHDRIAESLDDRIRRPNNGQTLELHVANFRAEINVATALGRIVIRAQCDITTNEIGFTLMDAVGVKQMRLVKDTDNEKILSIRPQVSVSIGRLIANRAGYEKGSTHECAGPGRARVSEGCVPKDRKIHAAAHGHEVGLKKHIERRRETAG